MGKIAHAESGRGCSARVPGELERRAAPLSPPELFTRDENRHNTQPKGAAASAPGAMVHLLSKDI
jgi:hypothetical protein